MSAIRRHWRYAASTILVLAGFTCGLLNHFELAATLILWGWILDQPPLRLRPNQAVVTAPIEPSADMRQFAGAVTQLRVALINEGMTSEQARDTIADLFRASQGGQ